MKLEVNSSYIGKRADAFLSNALGISRVKAQLMLDRGLVKQEKPLKKSSKLKAGIIEYEELEVEEIDLVPQDIPIDIVYEDSNIAVVNKAPNIVVHPGNGNKKDTLVNALLHKLELSGINAKIRPGIVHRLDKETSGLIVIAKNDTAHNLLAEQFKNREVVKEYYALVDGIPSQRRGAITTNIGRCPRFRIKMAVVNEGKEAISSYEMLEFNEKKNISLLKVKIETGRTHQIRVHLSYLGFPVLGDSLYGKRKSYKRHYLHCYKLGFNFDSKYVENITELPEDFKELLYS